MSPRPRKTRNCICRFQGKAFKLTGVSMTELEKVYLHPDELEVINLCDFEGMNQEEAGARIGVSRGTVQRTLATARKKIAEALTQGKAIIFAEDQSGQGE